MKKGKIRHIAKRITVFAAVVAMAAALTFPIRGGESFFGFDNAIAASAETYTAEYNLSEASVVSVTINQDGTYRIYSDDMDTPVQKTIIVASGVSANITLENVNIDVSSLSDIAAFKIEDNSTGNVTIDLKGENTLKSGKKCAGLQKNGGTGKLTIKSSSGDGELTANGGSNGAGIGGGNRGSGSNIEISGGTVTANGGGNGAGIGGGYWGDGSDITISGGTVTASGDAGIGGGYCGDGSDITISGGTVTASGGVGIGGGFEGSGSNITISGGTVTATGSSEGAGIGGGFEGSGSDITISGGTVTANGGDYGAGIGGGWDGDCSNITISGGSVKAVAGTDANAIGGGYSGNGAVTPTSKGTTPVYLLTIENPDSAAVLIDGKAYTPVNHKAADRNDGNLYAYLTGETCEVKVGDKNFIYVFCSESSNFALAPLTINATNSNETINFGTDYTYADGVLTVKTEKAVTIANTDPTAATTERIEVESGVSANITLAGVNIDVSSLSDTAAFKIADNSTGNVTITLADGSGNTLKSGTNCAGLQKNGSGDSVGKLTIKGGTKGTGKLTATCNYQGAGIGGGKGGSGSKITISGGTVTANGGAWSAGIGGGANGSGSNIEINGCTVTATGGSSGAGIGGGISSFGSNIKISGGNVTAKGGYYSAGIGGGYNGSGSDITISGGTVTAEGGAGKIIGTDSAGGAGIGGGASGSGSNIIISGGSVKAVKGTDANAIGGGNGKDAVIPTNGTDNVYLLTMANPDGAAVLIDGKAYTPVNHKAADRNDGNLYAYLTGETHLVKVGDKTFIYVLDNDTLAAPPLEIKATNGGTLTYGTDYTYANGVLTVKTEKAVTIANADPTAATTDTVVVAKDISANITLDGVNIDVSGTGDLDTFTAGIAAFKIEDDSTGNVIITLADGSENTLKGGVKCAGLQKNGDYISADKGKLTIKGGTNGTGKLIAIGGKMGAGIGGGNGGSGSNIEITGGTVTATSLKYGAGIGGGSGGSGSNITISGGTVTANGNAYGAGIGGGSEGSGSDITISGGTVTANGGFRGAGIGGGVRNHGSNIKITGGSVKAVAGTDANAIGGGLDGNGAVTPTNGTENVYLLTIKNPNSEVVTIDGVSYSPVNHKALDSNDGNLYAYLNGETHLVKVGEKTFIYVFENGTFAVTPLTIYATNNNETLTLGTDYTYADGVLTVKTEKAVTIANADPTAATTDTIVVAKDVSANITLDGVNIDVSSLSDTAAFKIEDNSTGDVTIDLVGENTLKSGKNCAGLQKNGTYTAALGTLTIKSSGGDGKLIATGGEAGAGIGGSPYQCGLNITISGGTVTANGGNRGAGIGGGAMGSGSDITISGGTVTANGGFRGAGIGGGDQGFAPKITITGGSVKAAAGTNANAIGGGNRNDAVTPTNGTENVYLLTIANPDGAAVFIDDSTIPYKPANHSAADENDTNLYVYLTGTTHSVTVGTGASAVTTYYNFNPETNEFLPVSPAISAITVYDGTAAREFDTLEAALAAYKTSKAELTIRLNNDANVKTLSLPTKAASITFEGIGALNVRASRIRIPANTTINTALCGTGRTPLAVKVSAGKTLTINGETSNIGAVSGTSTSVLNVNADMTAASLASFKEVTVAEEKTLTVTGKTTYVATLNGTVKLPTKAAAAKVTTVGNAEFILTDGDLAKVNVSGVTDLLTITVADTDGEETALASGMTVLYSSNDISEKVSVANKTEDDKTLDAFYYANTRSIKAECPDAVTLLSNGENAGQFPNTELALASITDSSTDYTVTLNTYVLAAAVTLPKTAKSITLNGTGTLITDGTSILIPVDTTIECNIAQSAGKTVALKAAAGKTLEINSAIESLGAVSGTKTSVLKVNADVTAASISTFEEVTVEEGRVLTVTGKTTLVTKLNGTVKLPTTAAAATLTAVGNAEFILTKGDLAKAKVNDVTESLKITVVSPDGAEVSLASGTIVLYTAGKTDFTGKVTIANKTSTGLDLKPIRYTGEIKAECTNEATLSVSDGTSSEQYRDITLALASITDPSKDYVLTLYDDISTERITLPTKANSLTIKSSSDAVRTISLTRVTFLSVKIPLTLENVGIESTKPFTISAAKDLTLDNFVSDSVSTVRGDSRFVLDLGKASPIAKISGFGTINVNADFTVGTTFTTTALNLGENSGITVSGTRSAVSAKTLNGADGSYIKFEQGFTPVKITGTAADSVTGTIALKADSEISESTVLFTTQTIGNGVFDITEIQPEGSLFGYTMVLINGKAYIRPIAFDLGGNKYALWTDVAAVIEAAKASKADYTVTLLDDHDIGGAIKLPGTGTYGSLTITSDNKTLSFTGNVTSTGALNIANTNLNAAKNGVSAKYTVNAGKYPFSAENVDFNLASELRGTGDVTLKDVTLNGTLKAGALTLNGTNTVLGTVTAAELGSTEAGTVLNVLYNARSVMRVTKNGITSGSEEITIKLVDANGTAVTAANKSIISSSFKGSYDGQLKLSTDNGTFSIVLVKGKLVLADSVTIAANEFDDIAESTDDATEDSEEPNDEDTSDEDTSEEETTDDDETSDEDTSDENTDDESDDTSEETEDTENDEETDDTSSDDLDDESFTDELSA